MSGLIGKKVGMTSVFDNVGRNIPVTVVEIEPCAITQIKTEETDGYKAVQLAAFDRKEKNLTNPVKGHFNKAGVSAKHKIVEFRDYIPEGLEVGDELTVSDVFSVGDIVDVVGSSKGKGFTGVVKRQNFSGAAASHGQKGQTRSTGSVGNAASPSKVFKGKKMPGQSGNTRVKIKNLSVAKILEDSNVMLLTGSIPGPNGTYVEIYNKTSVIK